MLVAAIAVIGRLRKSRNNRIFTNCNNVANKSDFTYEQLGRAFRSYLAERFDGDAKEVSMTVETAERIIPNTLNDYFGTKYESIYNITEIDDVEDLRRKIKTHPILKNLDMSVEPRYTEVLKWYRLFLKALNANAVPMPVYGEYDDTNHPSGTMATEPPVTPKPTVETTIYLEGEAGEAQPAELRKRNKILRQACINYYKALHGGHIFCECCGFDFQKAYDIDDEYIEIHHRFSFSQTEGEHPVNSQTDLVPLCANCHRMIHHGQGGKGNCMSLEELKRKYKGIRYKNE